jgi:crossover junction endodeoxyribonuclease RuvC
VSGTDAGTPLVLGVDPGLRVCGWGLLRAGATPAFVDSGVVRPKPRETIERRLLFLHQELLRVIQEWSPSQMAIEDPFVGALTPASALAIGQARAAAVLAAARHGLTVDFYAPAAVKAAVSGYGQSDKRQVQTMVRLLLALDADPEPADAADALAVAICHAAQHKLRASLGASLR